jgi:hypothetical protein
MVVAQASSSHSRRFVAHFYAAVLVCEIKTAELLGYADFLGLEVRGLVVVWTTWCTLRACLPA